MELLTQNQRSQLLVNGADPEGNHAPVVKLFNPAGAGTWLLSRLVPDDPDVAFGLCDLGRGFPELGYVRISELENLRLPWGFKVERDLHFEATAPIREYWLAAFAVGHIVDRLDRARTAPKS